MHTHKQTIVKVNASVDVGMALIVSTLSRWSLLRTVESCEDLRASGPQKSAQEPPTNPGIPEDPFICFTYGLEDQWRTLPHFLFTYFIPTLRDYTAPDDFSIHVKTFETGYALAFMHIKPGRKQAVELALAAMAKEEEGKAQ